MGISGKEFNKSHDAGKAPALCDDSVYRHVDDSVSVPAEDVSEHWGEPAVRLQ